MRMHNPPHPGEVLKGLYFEPMALSVTAGAAALGVSRKTLSAILNGRAGISSEMALRLAQAFDTTPEIWINMQAKRDLWEAEQAHPDLKVQRLVTRGKDGTSPRPMT